MKIKIFFLQVIYFSLRLCLKFIFQTRYNVGTERVFYIQSNIEIILEILLLTGLSFGMCRYILKSNKMIYTSLWICLSLVFLFEVSKYIDYLLGFLPHWGCSNTYKHHSYSISNSCVCDHPIFIMCNVPQFSYSELRQKNLKFAL